MMLYYGQLIEELSFWKAMKLTEGEELECISFLFSFLSHSVQPEIAPLSTLEIKCQAGLSISSIILSFLYHFEIFY